jgi:hypothetical protein
MNTSFFDGATVDLEVDGVGLIIECETGVRYRRDTAGIYQIPKSTEGVFVPLEAESEGTVRKALREIFEGNITASLDELFATRIESVLRKSARLSLFTVDRARLDASASSWVWVKWDAARLEESNVLPFAGFSALTGALVWPNY